MDLRRKRLSRFLSLLMSAFSLPIPPGALTGRPSQAYGTLRYHVNNPKKVYIRSFGAWLEPRYIFGAGRLDQ